MRYVFRASISLVVIFIIIVISEAFFLYKYKGYRFFFSTNNPNYRLDKDLIYSRLPNKKWLRKTNEFEEKVVSNSIGFRNEEIQEKLPGTFRIIAVGDSFTFGDGIDNNSETYPKQLEKYLRETLSGNKKIEVINAAEKGYSPDQEFSQIKKRLLPFKADMIIWNLSFPGDLLNLVHYQSWPIPALYDIRNNQLVELNARLNWLYISNYLRYKLPILNKSYLFDRLVLLSAEIKAFNRKPLLQYPDMLSWAQKKLLLELIEVQTLSKKNNFRLVVSFLPYRHTFSKEYKNSIESKIINQLKGELKKRNIAVIDVKEEVDRYLNKMSLQEEKLKKTSGTNDISVAFFYHKKNYHPNKEGAHLFADLIGDKIMPIIVKINNKN